jgi:hypothetical protein
LIASSAPLWLELVEVRPYSRPTLDLSPQWIIFLAKIQIIPASRFQFDSELVPFFFHLCHILSCKPASQLIDARETGVQPLLVCR